jgi:hypothetical protein
MSPDARQILSRRPHRGFRGSTGLVSTMGVAPRSSPLLADNSPVCDAEIDMPPAGSYNGAASIENVYA